jgi:hypothetical protein
LLLKLRAFILTVVEDNFDRKYEVDLITRT